MSARLRRELESHIPDNIEIILEALRAAREILKSKKDFSSLSAADRGELLKRIVNNDALLTDLIACYQKGELNEFLIDIWGSVKS